MQLRDRAAPRSGEFFAPLPLLALAVLVVNDVELKHRFHNFCTGKLSDVAVCFLMPLFVSELLGLAFAMTGDWTDLACVPLVGVAYLYGAGRLSRKRRASSRSAPALA